MNEDYIALDEIDDLYDDSNDEDSVEIDNQYLIIRISESQYALPVSKMKEIILLPATRPYPDMKPHERGLFKLRDETVYVTDLRKRLGYESIEEENQKLHAMFMQRREEHLAWLEELVSTVKEGAEFKLTTDPHQCKFGRWYDNFATNSISFQTYLSEFDLPHKLFHAMADRALAVLENEGKKPAIEFLKQAQKGDLKTLLHLFDRAEAEIKASHREITVILEVNDSSIGFTADKVESILNVKDEQIDRPKSDTEKSQFMSGTFKLNDEVYVILDPDKLY